jgi:hypothetical protein
MGHRFTLQVVLQRLYKDEKSQWIYLKMPGKHEAAASSIAAIVPKRLSRFLRLPRMDGSYDIPTWHDSFILSHRRAFIWHSSDSWDIMGLERLYLPTRPTFPHFFNVHALEMPAPRLLVLSC